MSKSHFDSMRHSCAHLLAAAVLDLWPGSHNAIGPSIEDGFYQDFDLGEVTISEKDLPKIEKRMKKILATWGPFEEKEVSAEQAKKDFAYNPYKLELIGEFEIEGKKITENNPGNFLDLCKGGHSSYPKEELKHFKLLKVAGAYWRGDANNKMLTRIYGTCFPSQEELDVHLTMLEEAKNRDHRKIGEEMDLFCFSDLVGAGLPMFTPKGTVLLKTISNFLNGLKEAKGYQEVNIPHLAKSELYKTSGHWDKFSDDIMIVKGKSEEFLIKPMNCPHHAQIYAARPRSYRDLPLRYAEITKQYRDEQTGELHGLSRVRSITIDDTHIFARPDQILQEAKNAYDIIHEFYKAFGIGLKVRLSIRDPKNKDAYLGTDELWKNAQEKLEELLKKEDREYFVGEGEAAFYGPKLDFMGVDSIGRTWQLSTIQVDFNQPERFQLSYVDEHGEKVQPVMIHVAVAGSLERLLSIMIEHFAGAFPLWLSPVQIQLIAVGGDHKEYCHSLAQKLLTEGLRVEVDDSDETVGKKVSKAEKQKVPYMLVIGDKEINSEKLMIRKRGEKEVTEVSREEFLQHTKKLINERLLEL